MKAIIYTKYGSPDVLKLKEIAKPIPKDNEVLIKIHATTVNRTDLAIIKAIPFFARFFTGLFRPKKQTPGSEFAGEIVAIGENISHYNVGDKVFGFDEMGTGSHAQFMTIAEDKAFLIMPKNITYESAAASIEGAHYGYNFINKVNLQRGDKVLVNGGTGGIGSATIQLLKHFGADITATCKSKDFELVKKLGAGKVIDFTLQDFTRDTQKYDFIFDSVGKSSFFKCKRLLKPKGVYISSELGYMAQNVFLPLITPILRGKKTRFPLPTNLKASIHLIKKLINKGNFKAVIDRTYPLEQTVEAFKYVEKGQKIGNVVITVGHDK